MTKSKLKALSNLSANFSEIFFASLVIPVVTGGIDNYQLELILLGLAGTLISGYFSLKFADEGKL